MAEIKDEFADAFAELAKRGETSAAPNPDPAAAPAAKPQGEVPPQDSGQTVAATPAPSEGETPASEGESGDGDVVSEGGEGDSTPAVAADEGPSEEDILRRLAGVLKKTSPEPAPQPAPQQTHEQVAQEPPVFTPEEAAVLTAYEQDYPEVAKAEAIRRRAEYKFLMNHFFTEVAKQLLPIVNSVEEINNRTQYEDLRSTVEDYDDIRGKVIEWVGKQPAYLQPAYNHVIKAGTVDEVNDLISRYRQATGQTAAPAKSAQAPAARKAETELPLAAKKAVAALAPVSSKRSAVVQAVDPMDFEAAFKDFAEKV